MPACFLLFPLQTSPEALPHEIAIARLSLATNSEAFTSVASAMGAEQLANAAMGLATKATEEAWLVCNGLTGGNARDMAVRAGNTTGVKMIPWVGVAARFSQSSHAHTEAAPDAAAQPAADGAVVSQQGGDLSVQAAKPSVSGGGQAFCFLPLPVRTGLPVHVNAFFELSSNRRDIW
jgi:sacsin